MENSDTASSNSEARLVLIAEDEEVNYHFLAMLLATLYPNYKILHARDGQEAVDLFKNNEVDLVLMDIKMPNMDGYEATRLIKSMKPDAKIIAQTALAAVDARDKAIAAGCDDFITKPVDKSLLASSIAQLTA